MKITDEIRKLIDSPKRPSLAEILPIAQKYEFSTPAAFWEFFDTIIRLWSESKWN